VLNKGIAVRCLLHVCSITLHPAPSIKPSQVCHCLVSLRKPGCREGRAAHARCLPAWLSCCPADLLFRLFLRTAPFAGASCGWWGRRLFYSAPSSLLRPTCLHCLPELPAMLSQVGCN
jgi:hypothetical protein